MEKKIVISALSEIAALQKLEQINRDFINNLETNRPDLFEVKDNWSQSKFAIMGTIKVPEVHDRINLDIIDDLEEPKLITVYYPENRGMTEAKTIPGMDNLNRLTDAEIKQLEQMISLMPNGGPADLGQLYKELGKIGNSFSYVKPKKEAKITPNPATRQYKSKRK